MLENVNSIYIIKFLFSFLNDKRGLEIVKYNKKAQNILDLSIKNYKLFSDCYLILDKNGIGKEYFIHNNRLKFEGKYLNGKRNGFGKEYNGFEGEYLNGKRNGKGKEYSGNDLIFEGEYKNNKRWSGKGYNKKNIILCDLNKCKGISMNEEQKIPIYELKNGKGIYKEYSFFHVHTVLTLEGEYKNGELNGKCKEYYANNTGRISFEGEYLNGKKWNGKGYDINGNKIYELINGKGFFKQYDSESQILQLLFEGDYINGEKNGKGKEYSGDDLIFEGEYKDGKKNGKGKCYNQITGELEFEGDFLYDWKFKGKEYVKGKLEFEGEYYFNNKYSGKGYDENGNILYVLNNGSGKVRFYDWQDNLDYDGELLNGKKNGQGKHYINNILIYEGQYLNGERNGKGKEYNITGDYLEYEGEFLNNTRNGKGKEYHHNGIIKKEGEYINGDINGIGKEYNEKGKLIYEGEYLKGYRNGNGKEYNDDGILIFEGKYLNGQRTGKGKEYNDEGLLIYEGKYINGVKDGKGKVYDYKSNKIYEVNYIEGLKMGEAKIIKKKIPKNDDKCIII